MSKSCSPGRRSLLLQNPVVVGICALFAFVAGGTLFAFINAEGFLMLTDSPKACVQCHIMGDVYESYIKGDHARQAGCVDCHLPHDTIGYWSKKAYHGLKHGFYFTIGGNPANLDAAAMTHSDVNNQCAYCHADLSHNAINATLGQEQEQLDCLRCHRGVGHMHN